MYRWAMTGEAEVFVLVEPDQFGDQRVLGGRRPRWWVGHGELVLAEEFVDPGGGVSGAVADLLDGCAVVEPAGQGVAVEGSADPPVGAGWSEGDAVVAEPVADVLAGPPAEFADFFGGEPVGEVPVGEPLRGGWLSVVRGGQWCSFLSRPARLVGVRPCW